MSAALKKIRHLVFLRAKNACECGCGRWVTEESMHLDHFWGRARQESVESCWALHPECDQLKTLNKPDWSAWGTRFLAHVRGCMLNSTGIGMRSRYLEQEKQAISRLEWMEAFR